MDADRAQLAAGLASPAAEDRAVAYGALARLGPRAVAVVQVLSAQGDLAASEVCVGLGVQPFVHGLIDGRTEVGEHATRWREFAMGLELNDKPNRQSKPRKVAGARIAQALVNYALAGWLRRHRDLTLCENGCASCRDIENHVAAGRLWLALHDKPYSPAWKAMVRDATGLLGATEMDDASGWPSLVAMVVADNASLGDQVATIAAQCGEVSTSTFGLDQRVRHNGCRIVTFAVRDRALEVTKILLS